jgi:UDP-2,3-diacylglucosamine pyrophosphatase LpxH
VSQMVRLQQYRTIWISDLHLGTRGCKAEFLVDFLRYNDADTIYLVGDIIDGWRLKRSWYWPQAHNDVVQKVLRKVRKGTRVIYVPGNHDEWLRDYTLLQFGGVEVADEAVHVTADGRRLLVIHGDVFDAVVKHARWLAMLGDGAYTTALWLNRYFNTVRRRLGYQYWSLSAYLKHRVKNAMQYIGSLPMLWRMRRAVAASTASFAAISITPRCAESTACCIATMAIGSKAARLSSSISTERLN